MMLTVVPVAELDVLAEPEAIEVLMDDPDWLEAEFAAVMAASGVIEPFDLESTVCRPAPHEDQSGGVAALRPSLDAELFLAVGTEARTRSPPAG